MHVRRRAKTAIKPGDGRTESGKTPPCRTPPVDPVQLHHLLPAAMLGAAALVALLAFRLRYRTVPGTLAPILLGRRHRVAPLVTALVAITVWLALHALDLLVGSAEASAWPHRAP